MTKLANLTKFMACLSEIRLRLHEEKNVVEWFGKCETVKQ